MLKAVLTDLKLFASLIIIALFLTVFDNLGFLNLPKSLIQTITIPIQYGLYNTSRIVTRQFEFIVLSRRASQEKKALTEQLALVLSENAQLRRKLAEAEGFIEQKKVLDPQEFEMVAARPVGKSRYLIIDKGSENGVKTGQAVVYKDNFIGRIKDVSVKKSTVTLPSDPDSKISTFVNSSDGKAKGVLIGQFGSEMLLDKVLHQEPLKKNDLVYSEGAEEQIPRGLILGRVLEVFERDNEVFKQAKVGSIFDIGNLDVVFVITN